MIIKSMSRKEPSFGQLTAYMSDEKSDRDYDLHNHVFSRDPASVAAEFEGNAKLLGKRRNGNYLYHEILSLDTRACGQGAEVKAQLRLLALDYVARRCPRNMVFGTMHEDHKDHLHYHLMISANQKGDTRRLRLPKATYEAAKRETERQALEEYPELKQVPTITASNEEKAERRDKRKSRKVQEMEKRGAKLTQKEQLAQELRGIMSYANSQEELERLLADKGYAFYTRGKHFGIKPTAETVDGKKPKAHRFATLGVDEDYAAFLERTYVLVEDGRGEGEKEKEGRDAEALEEQERAASERDGAGADKDTYVKYGSNTDLKRDPVSQQNPQVEQDAFLREMRDERAKRATKNQERAKRQERGGRRR